MENFYNRKEMKKFINQSDNPNFNYHGISIPSRMLVIAPSGSGKSNFVCNLIQRFCIGNGTFDKIMIFCKDRSEPLYQYLHEVSKGTIEVHEKMDMVPQINELNKNEQTLIIFDDMVLDKYPIISEYWIRGRKKGCTTIYLSQSFYSVPKIIRQNTRYFVILKLAGSRDINMILKDLSLGLTKQELLNLYNYATKEKFSCLIIDNDSNENKFRKNFDEILH